MKQRMKAVLAGSGVAALHDMERPVPGYGQVLIRVAAAGVNRADLLQKQGKYPVPSGASEVPGLEVAGTVVAVGKGVDAFTEGDSVMALLEGGGYAEYAAAEAGQCLPVPSGLTMVEAASLPEAMFTVWLSLMEKGAVRAGERVLVHGGGSGIGVMAIQMLKAFGAWVAVTAGNDEKCARCRTLGADLAVQYREEDFAAALQPEGVDVILDMVGGDYTPRHLSILKRDGRLIVIAFQRGAKAEMNLGQVLMKRLSIVGTTLRSRIPEEKARLARAIRGEVLPLIENGRIRPVVDSVFPLNEVEMAHQRMENSFHFGKIVLQILH